MKNQFYRCSNNSMIKIRLGLSLATLISCNSVEMVSSAFGPNRKAYTQEDPSILSHVDKFEISEEAQYFKRLESLASSEYLDQVISSATNERFVVRGYTITNYLDFLRKNENILREVTLNYATVGDFLRSVLGIFSWADMDSDWIDMRLQFLEKETLRLSLETNKAIDDSALRQTEIFYLQGNCCGGMIDVYYPEEIIAANIAHNAAVASGANAPTP